MEKRKGNARKRRQENARKQKKRKRRKGNARKRRKVNAGKGLLIRQNRNLQKKSLFYRSGLFEKYMAVRNGRCTSSDDAEFQSMLISNG
jgi:hypothetical protein